MGYGIPLWYAYCTDYSAVHNPLRAVTYPFVPFNAITRAYLMGAAAVTCSQCGRTAAYPLFRLQYVKDLILISVAAIYSHPEDMALPSGLAYMPYDASKVRSALTWQRRRQALPCWPYGALSVCSACACVPCSVTCAVQPQSVFQEVQCG